MSRVRVPSPALCDSRGGKPLHPPCGRVEGEERAFGEGLRESESLHLRNVPMTERQRHPDKTIRGRSLRKTQTISEGLLWSVLRGKQVSGLKFRRQHPIESWIVDFACPEKMLVVEIDGSYHDNVVEDDRKRQRNLEGLGWKVIRFTDKEVEDDSEAVARAIARELNVPYKFKPRKATGSGMKNVNAAKRRRLS